MKKTSIASVCNALGKIVAGSSILMVLAWNSAGAAPVGIASGQKTGTNYPMIEDIKRVCSNPKSPITNRESDGSLDNLALVYGDPSAQYGLTQADALFYQKGVDPKMMDRIQVVFPFFSSEINLVVRDDSPIKTINDLAGKRVVEDVEGSGSWVSVQVIKTLTKIKWAGANGSQAQGLAAVKSGKADAFFINAGRPIKMLEGESGLRIVPISHPALDQFKLYTKVTIPSGTYPFQKSSVTTYKTDNLLVTYAFKSQYQQEIGDLVSCVTRNLETLQKSGHPKWKSVDPSDIESVNWQIHPAALAAIKKAKK